MLNIVLEINEKSQKIPLLRSGLIKMRFFYFFRRTGHSREKRQPEDREGGLPEPAPMPTAKGRATSGGKSQSGPRDARKSAEFARKTSANKQKSAERQKKSRAPIATEAPAVREKAERVRGKPARYTPSSEQPKELSDKMSAGTRGAAGAGAGTAAGAAVREKTGAAKSAALDYRYVSEDGLFRCLLCPEIQSRNIRHVNTMRHQQRAAAYEATLQGSAGQEVGGKRREASPSPRPAPKKKAPNARQGAAGKQLVSVVSEPANTSARELRVLLEALPVERNARRPRKSSSEDEGSPVDGPARGEKADGVRAKTTSDEAAGVSAVARRKSPRNHQARGGGQRERDAAGEEAGPPAAAAAAPPPVKKGVAAKKAARLSSEEPLPTKRGRPAKKQKVQQSLQVGCDTIPIISSLNKKC